MRGRRTGALLVGSGVLSSVLAGSLVLRSLSSACPSGLYQVIFGRSMTSYTLVVDVVSANGLSGSPDSLNPCVELRFAGQTYSTSIKNRVCCPVAVWNETIRFSALDKYKVAYSTLEAYVYNVIASRRSFIGRVRISGSIFANSTAEIAKDYPLRGGIFPRSKGTVHLKVLLQKERPINTIDHLSRFVSSRSEATQEVIKPADVVVKEYKPSFEHGMIVERIPYIFVHVVKAQHLPCENTRGRLNRYVQVKVGESSGTTEYMDMERSTAWNATFAFSQLEMDDSQMAVVHVIVKNMDGARDDSVGMVSFDVCNIRASNEPVWQWHHLLDETSGERTKGELMLAVWRGSQADEKFRHAWKSDSCMGPTVYVLPHMWYLRVQIFEIQCDPVASGETIVDMNAMAALGDQLHTTRRVKMPLGHHVWNEEFMFVAAQPFEESLRISVQAHLGSPDRHRVIGEAFITLQSVEKRVDDRHVQSQWFVLQMPVEAQAVGSDRDAELTMSSCRIRVTTCLEGGYTVRYDSTDNADEVRPADMQIVGPAVGLLEIGILGAAGLYPRTRIDGERKLHPYCVAKYGRKWVRTRTVKNSCNPVFNEQYAWDVYDTSTVLTVGVFDNAQLEGYSSEESKAVTIGKIRIRLSYLQLGRTNTKSYPLLVIHPSGVKLVGELRLAVRFSANSVVKVLQMYSSPILPEMHYRKNIPLIVQENLRANAVGIVAARFGRMETPLWKEVVEYMCDMRSNLWSMRKSKANLLRCMNGISALLALYTWFHDICLWKNPFRTWLVHVLFLILVVYPELMSPVAFLYIIFIALLFYRWRPFSPPIVDTRLSQADEVHSDELEEEFDSVPTSQNLDTLRMRYDRLRLLAGRMQTVLGDLASHLERIQALISWKDTTLTATFGLFTLLAFLVVYFAPCQIVLLSAGLYTMRHPKLRGDMRMPSVLANIYWRFPPKTDSLL